MASIRLLTRKRRCLFRLSLLALLCVSVVYVQNGDLLATSFASLKLNTELHYQLKRNVRQLSEAVKMAGLLYARNEYICIPNILPADNMDQTSEANGIAGITWCSSSTDNNLHYLHKLMTLWDGPISIAVFTYGGHVTDTLRYISALHHCDANIKRKVNFHLCVPGNQFEGHPTVDQAPIDGYTSCKHMLERQNMSINYGDKQVAYPVNVLRNVAIENAHTHYVLNADIDLLPSKYLYRSFTELVQSFPKANPTKNAYVLPCFETNATPDDSVSKAELLAMWSRGVVRPFYSTVCGPCQNNTDYDRWRSLAVGNDMNVAYSRNWTYLWEPFVITDRREAPYFDERFKRYGFNRISQMCELHMKGFQFAVLDNGFLIHSGFKEQETFHEDRKKENTINLRLYDLFKEELKRRYPGTGRDCSAPTRLRSSRTKKKKVKASPIKRRG